MLLSELASILGLVLQGEDGSFDGLNTLEAATDREVSFLANPKYTHYLATTKARAVIIPVEYADQVPTALISESPYMDFAKAGTLFQKKQGEASGLSPLATIDPTATLGENSTVYPYAFIGPRVKIGRNAQVFPGAYVGEDCCLGDNCILYPHAVIMAGVTAGDNCIFDSGSIVGTEGFGFIRMGDEVHKIPQIGTVTIGNDVLIGANSCVDKSAIDATRIGNSSKLDNLVQVGHNVQLGEQCFLISQVGIAGSTHVGNRVTMAGQAGISGHLTIGDDVTIGPQSGVARDIPAGTTGGGAPFMERRTFLRNVIIVPRLPEMHQRLKNLEKELVALKELLVGSGSKENS